MTRIFTEDKSKSAYNPCNPRLKKLKPALFYRLVDEYTGCHRHIERLNLAFHRNLYPFVAEGEVFVRHTRVFRTQDDAGGVGIVRLGVILITLLGGSYHLETAFLQELDGVQEVLFAADGQGVECSGRGLDGIGIHAHTVLGRDDDGIHSGTFARTGDGTEIAHVGDAVQHNEQRIAALLEEEGDNLFGALVGDGGDVGDHSLMVLARDAVDALHGDALDGDEGAFQGGKQFFG